MRRRRASLCVLLLLKRVGARFLSFAEREEREREVFFAPLFFFPFGVCRLFSPLLLKR